MAKTPRMDRCQRLIMRFYETLFILGNLGKTHGPHRRVSHDPNDPTAIRRRFLDNLAFCCDAEKGGRSVTALAVESLEHCNLFWIASNSVGDHDIAGHLTNILKLLQQYPKQPEDKRLATEKELLRICTDFARKRIKDEARMLSSTVKRCFASLKGGYHADMQGNDKEFTAWLLQFTKKDPSSLNLCQRAYDARRVDQMIIVMQLGRVPADGSNASDAAVAFQSARHLIGRLADHVRAVKQLCEDVSHVERLIETYSVERLVPPPAVPRPEADGHTNMAGILKRLIPPHEKRQDKIKDALLARDHHHGLEKTIVDMFENERFEPCVHAEVQVLDYFYLGQGECRPFADDDRYVACSKPACFCCKLWFRHHPARCAEPDSHENVWPKWSPVSFQGSDKEDEDFHVLISVHQDLREKVFQKLLHQGGFARTHQDSLTAITGSDEQVGEWGYDSAYGSEAGSSDAGMNTPSQSTEAVPVETDDESDGEEGGARLE